MQCSSLSCTSRDSKKQMIRTDCADSGIHLMVVNTISGC